MGDGVVNRERLLTTFLEMAAINAPSRREGAMARYVTRALSELGAEVVEDNAGAAVEGETGNLIARLPGTAEAPAVLFCAHLDTVEPTEALVIQRRDGEIASDGATILGADDKAAVAALLEMLRVLTETGSPRPPVELAFTVAEEVGLMGSQVLDYSLLTAHVGFVPDGSGEVGMIITRAPAQRNLRATVRGRAAHAGMAPEEGVNAIAVAARAIAAMRQGRIDEETTANIGVIHGGKATNIVPDTVRIEGEARSRDPRKLAEQVAHMRACLEEEAARAGAAVSLDISDVYPAFTVGDDTLPVALARRAAEAVGISPTVAATGGGSDANYFNAHGIQAVILSAGYQGPHSVHERIAEDQLVLLARWLCAIVQLAAAR